MTDDAVPVFELSADMAELPALIVAVVDGWPDLTEREWARQTMRDRPGECITTVADDDGTFVVLLTDEVNRYIVLLRATLRQPA